MKRVRLKAFPDQWGYVNGEGILTVPDIGVQYFIVRVLWANDAVGDVPPSLQYLEDLEEIP